MICRGDGLVTGEAVPWKSEYVLLCNFRVRSVYVCVCRLVLEECCSNDGG